MFCAISGKPPLHPVVSTKSRALFEKSLLVQYVNEHGSDPISKDPMTTSDILEINTKSSNTNANILNSSTLNTNYSIPNLLSTLQNEWDAIMQENFLLRQKLDTLSKNLSQALYERDAAKIIAAKYMSGEKITVPKTSPIDFNVETSPVINYELLLEKSTENRMATKPSAKNINSLQKDLLKNIGSCNIVKPIKKIETVFTGACPVSSYNLKDVSTNFSNYITLGQNESSEREIVSLDDDNVVSFTSEMNFAQYLPKQNIFLCTGNEQNSCGVYDIQSQKDKKICHLPNERILGLFDAEGMYNDTISGNTSNELNYIAACASGSVYLINEDHFYPIIEGTSDENSKKLFNGVAFHKDGLVVAFFNSQDIKIVNINQPKESPISVPTNFKDNQKIETLRFSANGYWLFVGVEGSVLTYDLRKVPMTCTETDTEASGKAWDIIPSGKIMAAINATNETILFYSYVKTSNSWKIKHELKIDISESPEDIISLTLLYSNDKLGCLIFTNSQAYKCILE